MNALDEKDFKSCDFRTKDSSNTDFKRKVSLKYMIYRYIILFIGMK